jgi:hypothetical protein
MQQTLPTVQAAPDAMQVVQVPLTQTWPDEQHVVPHTTWPCVQATAAVAHVECDGLAHAVPF